MIPVSNAWKEAHKGFLLPETFVEITCEVVDVNAQDTAQAAVNDWEGEAVFSRCDNVSVESTTTPKYATLERNLWVLDGTHSILPSDGSSENPGYASPQNIGNLYVHTETTGMTLIPGITITWSSEYNEYPTHFIVQAWLNEMPVGEMVEVRGNTSNVSVVDLELTEYDMVNIYADEWSLPDHRVRVDNVIFGHVMTFGKKDIISYRHEQSGDLNSGELPKNAITFSLDNSDGKWHPINPKGLSRYLCERQKITTRYGMNVNGIVEWIPGGVFYLSEWRAPSNGLEASFVAKDPFDFMLNVPFGSTMEWSLSKHIERAFLTGGGYTYHLDPSVNHTYWGVSNKEDNTAAVVQMCANAACCVVWIDRNGEPHIAPLDKTASDYTIGTAVSYTHPEVTLTKPLKTVTVRYGGEQTAVVTVGSTGEDQTLDNPMIYDYLGTENETQPVEVAQWIADTLRSRTVVSGEFRADPRLDLYDIVTVEGKYGAIAPVAITNITYEYTGCFRATFEGRVLS